MTADELMPDSQCDTRRDIEAPKPMSLIGLQLEELDDLIQSLVRRRTPTAHGLITLLHQTRSDLRSWEVDANAYPTRDVRDRVLERLKTRKAMARALLRGER